MEKIVSLITAALFVTVSFAQKINDPNAEVREAKNFHAIKISNAFDVYITQGNEESVAVSASDTKYMQDIEVNVESGVLNIRVKKNGLKKMWNNGKMKLKAYISFKNINRLDVSGACDVFFQGMVKEDNLKFVLSGASNINGEFNVQKMDVNLSGASDITVKGSAANLKVNASGASDFKGFEFNTDYCDVDISGASGVKITVNKELSAKTSGASDVRYKGNGLIRDIRTSGSSRVSRG